MFGKKKKMQNRRGPGFMQQHKGVCPNTCGKVIGHEYVVSSFESIYPIGETQTIGSEEHLIEKDQIKERNLKNTRKYPNIDVDLCVGCGNCVDICPKGAIKLVNSVATISLDQCKGCRICVNACSVGAIS